MKRHVYLDERTVGKAKECIKQLDLVISLGSFFDLVLNDYIKANKIDVGQPRPMIVPPPAKSASTQGGLTSFEALVKNAGDPDYVPSNEAEAEAIASIRKNSAEATKPKPKDPHVPRDTEVITTPLDTRSALEEALSKTEKPLTEQEKESIRAWGGEA